MAISELMLNMLAHEEHERLMALDRAWLAYNGCLPPPLGKTRSDPTGQDNVQVNYARLIVDKGASFLFGNDMEYQIEGTDGGEEDDPRIETIEEIWRKSGDKALLHNMAVMGGVTGDVFLKLLRPVAESAMPRLVLLNSAYVFPFWSVEDYEDVYAYKIQWNAVDRTGPQAIPVVRRQLIERNETRTAWTITDQISRQDSIKWETLTDEIWPFAWGPVFHCQNLPAPGVYWGLSDIEPDTIDLNRALNFTLSNIARILRLHAHPQPIATGYTGRLDLDWEPGRLVMLPGEHSNIKYLEMVSDLSAALETFNRLKESLHEVTRVPEVATGKVDNIGSLSGVALRILYQSLIEKTETKRLLYGALLQDVNQRLLELTKSGTDIRVENHWPNILPVDEKSEAETGVLYDQLGVSRETILTRLGFDAEMEAERRAAQAQTGSEMGAAILQQFERGQLDNPMPGTALMGTARMGTAMMRGR